MGLLTPQEEAEARAQGEALQQSNVEHAAPALGERVTGAKTELYDPTTGKLLQLEPDRVMQAIETGVAAPRIGSRINVLGEGGVRGSVPAEELAAAIRAGYRPETAREASVGDYLDANAGLVGAAKVGIGKALSEAAMGVPEIIYKHAATPEEREQWAALKEAHPIASGIGTVAGFGGSMLVGGPLFQAAAKAGTAVKAATLAGKSGFGRALAASGAKLGVEGAILSAPQAVTEAALGDPKAAAEHLMLGLGGGALLGAAGTTVHTALRPLARMGAAAAEHVGIDFAAANPFEKLSARQTFRSLMHSQDERGVKLAQRAGGIDEVGKYIQDSGLDRGIGETFDKYATRVAERKEAVGSAIGAKYKELDAAGALGPSAETLAAQFRREVIDPLRTKAARSSEVQRLEGYTDDFLQAARIQRERRGVETEEEVGQSLYDLWETRKDLAAKIYQEKRTVGPLTPIDKEYDQFRQILDNAIQTGAQKAAGKEWVSGVKELNHAYKMLAAADQIVETSVVREAKNRSLSLSDYLAGGHAGIGLAFHSPVAAVGGLGVALGHHFLRLNGNQIVAKYSNKLGTYLAHRAQLHATEEIARLPSLIKADKSEAVLNGFHLLLGPEAPKTDAQAFEMTAKRINTAMDRVQTGTHALNETAAIVGNGAPAVAQAYQQAELARLSWLQNQMPKAPPTQPFGPKLKWKPSPAQIKDFRDKLAVALDPRVLLHEAARGTLSSGHVAAAKAVWPNAYKDMVNTAKTWGMTPDAAKLSTKKRQAMRALIAEPDPGTFTLQATFTPQEQQQPSSSAIKNIPGAEPSQMQRIST